MADKQTFTTVLIKHDRLDATGIEIPFDVERIFGAKRVAVKAVVNGAEYRGSIVRMGGKYLLGIPKVFRNLAGIAAGDNIEVTIERDLDERAVEIPADLAERLRQDPGLLNKWNSLSFTVRKEHARSIEDAKKPETRDRRLEKTLKFVAEKK